MPDNETPDASTVYLFGQTMTSIAACAPASLTRDEVEAKVNVQSPTAISSAWTVTDETELKDDSTGEKITHPLPCPDGEPGTRLHYLLYC